MVLSGRGAAVVAEAPESMARRYHGSIARTQSPVRGSPWLVADAPEDDARGYQTSIETRCGPVSLQHIVR